MCSCPSSGRCSRRTQPAFLAAAARLATFTAAGAVPARLSGWIPLVEPIEASRLMWASPTAEPLSPPPPLASTTTTATIASTSTAATA